MKSKYTKIIITEKHNIEKIKSIINAKKPKQLMLESSSQMNNLKTQWVAQKLINIGWSEVNVKLSYKGKLFKVILSNGNPVDAQDAKGAFTDPGGIEVDRITAG